MEVPRCVAEEAPVRAAEAKARSVKEKGARWRTSPKRDSTRWQDCWPAHHVRPKREGWRVEGTRGPVVPSLQAQAPEIWESIF